LNPKPQQAIQSIKRLAL